MKAKTTIAVAAAMVICGNALAETGKIAGMGASVVETYKVASGDELRIYIYNPEGHHVGGSLPAIVFFFGGGWTSGSPSQFKQHAAYLASRGMVAMCADYRVKSRQGTTAFECVADGKSAIRWVRENAHRLGVDPDRIAAGGGSAGGHVAAASGIVPGLDEKGENLDISSRSTALVLFNPVYDNGPEGGWGHDRVLERWREISPAHNIEKGCPPTIVFLGTGDKLIPVSTAERFKAEMERACSLSVLHLYEGQPHGFFNEGKGGREIFLDIIRKMDRFLVDLGYLEGEPTAAQIEAASGK
ncbi:MAG: alpha/beta hydrolase [Verrucomicrobiales bacterium]